MYRKGERGVADSMGGGVDHVDLVDPVPDLFWRGGGGEEGVGVYIPSHLHLWYSHFNMLKSRSLCTRCNGINTRFCSAKKLLLLTLKPIQKMFSLS